MTFANKIVCVGVLLASSLVTACFHCINGSGHIVEEKRVVSKFRSIDLDVPGTLYIAQRKTAPLTITTDDNIMTRIRTEVNGDTLRIRPSSKNCCLNPSELTITASAESLENLRISGSGDIVVQGEVKGERIALAIDGSGTITAETPIVIKSASISVDGSGDIDVELQAAELSTSVDGSGEIILSGAAGTHKIDIDGSGEIEALGFNTANTHVHIDGSGECVITVSEHLDVIINGSGDVRYRGTPRLIQVIDGSGSVQNI